MALFERLKPAASPPRLPETARRITLHEQDVDRLLQANQTRGRPGEPARSIRRFAAGWRCQGIEDGDELIAWLWMEVGSLAYAHELPWLKELGEGHAWGHDMYVNPSRRGMRLCTALWDAHHEHDPTPRRIFADIDVINTTSIRANESAGFVRIATMPILSFHRNFEYRVPNWARRWLK